MFGPKWHSRPTAPPSFPVALIGTNRIAHRYFAESCADEVVEEFFPCLCIQDELCVRSFCFLCHFLPLPATIGQPLGDSPSEEKWLPTLMATWLACEESDVVEQSAFVLFARIAKVRAGSLPPTLVAYLPDIFTR
jgi:hypothetical protein